MPQFGQRKTTTKTRPAQPPSAPTERRFGRKPPPPGETKEERFKRLAQKRTEQALEGMRLISNLATNSDYAWTQEQVTNIVTALQIGVDQMAERFAKRQPERKLAEVFSIDAPIRVGGAPHRRF